MVDDATSADSLTPIKRALQEIRRLKGELAEAREAVHAPIAVVGMALRFPGGAHDAESFARLIWSGQDAIGAIPAERWPIDALYDADPDAPGKMTTRHGGFLSQVDRFDAAFFGISPREAASMDPQQRLLMEVAWHALEDAGRAPSSLAGTRAGVFVGIANGDYGRALLAHADQLDAYVSTGNAYSVAAGRMSYFFGAHGPAVALDTACSSSLVAVHLACQSLRAGECDLALVGGVNLILTPEMNVAFSKARMMAPDGRCKTFDAAADGYVRGEGCAVLVLRRLSQAVADGDRVLAVLRGSAINQDGRSGGLTAPNGPAQESVLRAALRAADLPGHEIGYVEAHGTGTALGDPIEVGALSAVLCAGRDARTPLRIGSVKTNIGHLEAAAGLAGLVKVILALQRKQLPPSLHFQKGNPLIDWSAPLSVVTEPTEWAPIGGRRLAGVSSFGFSGTNAHVIVEEAPPATPAAPEQDRPVHVLTLSAREPDALRTMSRELVTALQGETPTGDLCFTTNVGRSHFEHRLCVVGANRTTLADGLSAFAKNAGHPALSSGVIEPARRPQVAFLCTGHGAQTPGMGRALYQSSTVFRAALDRCATALADVLPRPLLDVMFDADEATLNTSRYAQPATFALEYALSELWRAWGIQPVAVVGHSLGEYAAACVAGMFSVEDALRLVAERGRLSDVLPPGGAMGTIFASAERVQSALTRYPNRLWIAAYNGPEHVVVSGHQQALVELLAELDAADIRTKLLRIPYASHSPLVEPALADFRRALERVQWSTPHTAIVSNVSGALADPARLATAEYWLSHLRQPVRFAESMDVLAARGITHFVELGPHPVLLGMAAECLPGAFEWLPSLRRDQPDWSCLCESLQRLYVTGADVDWAGFEQGYSRKRVSLPGYAFQSRRHWADALERPAQRRAEPHDGWARLRTSIARQAERGPLDLNPDSYPAKWQLLARLTMAHAHNLFSAAGVLSTRGERRTLDDVLRATGIKDGYRHIVARWLARWVDDGLLSRDQDAHVVQVPIMAVDLSPLWAEAQATFADNTPLLRYVRHCCSLSSDVLRGIESPLETLFPAGSFELAEALYEQSTTMRYMNELAAASVEALVATAPGGRALRLLEVGAGTGGTSASVLPVLPVEGVEYIFSDVSDLFLGRAAERFRAYPFVRYARFDLDQEPAGQGFPAGSFDVIVSANAVHASVDLRAALQRLRTLLRPGGVLVLVESTTHLAWFDITTGLIEGWQHFADDLRTDHPLLDPGGWLRALREAGFEQTAAFPAEQSAARHLGQHLIVARVPGDAEHQPLAAVQLEAESVRPEPVLPREHDDAFVARLRAALPGERHQLLCDFVRERVMAVLRLDAARPPGRNERLIELGFDSLMAVQLRNTLSTQLGLSRPLPVTTLFDYPSIDALATRLLVLLAPPAESAPVLPTAEQAAPLGAEQVAAMSDAEIEAALMKRMSGR